MPAVPVTFIFFLFEPVNSSQADSSRTRCKAEPYQGTCLVIPLRGGSPVRPAKAASLPDRLSRHRLRLIQFSWRIVHRFFRRLWPQVCCRRSILCCGRGVCFVSKVSSMMPRAAASASAAAFAAASSAAARAPRPFRLPACRQRQRSLPWLHRRVLHRSGRGWIYPQMGYPDLLTGRLGAPLLAQHRVRGRPHLSLRRRAGFQRFRYYILCSWRCFGGFFGWPGILLVVAAVLFAFLLHLHWAIDVPDIDNCSTKKDVIRIPSGWKPWPLWRRWRCRSAAVTASEKGSASDPGINNLTLGAKAVNALTENKDTRCQNPEPFYSSAPFASSDLLIHRLVFAARNDSVT